MTRTSELGWWLRAIGGWCVVLLAVGLVTAAVALPRLAGGTAYTVLTGSMRPSLPPGTLVVTRPVAPETLAIGDVITYQVRSDQPAVVTHRVIALGYAASGEVTVRTRGDANGADDPEQVRAVQIRGRYWYAVPYLGYLNGWVSGSTRVVVLVAAVAGLLLYAMAMFASAARGRRDRSVPPPPVEVR